MGQASVLTDTEIRRVFRIIETTRHSERNRLAFALSIFAGLRVGEIAALAIGDVATVNGDVRREAKLGAHQTKGSKGRTVILSEHVRKEIRSFHLVSELGAGGEQRRQGAGRDEVIGAPQIGDDGLAHGAVKTLVLDYLHVGAMGRFFDAEKHGDLQKQATTESELVFPNQGPNIRKRGTTF